MNPKKFCSLQDSNSGSQENKFIDMLSDDSTPEHSPTIKPYVSFIEGSEGSFINLGPNSSHEEINEQIPNPPQSPNQENQSGECSKDYYINAYL